MSAKRPLSRARPAPAPAARPEVLLTAVRGLILEARQQTAQVVNAGLTLLYWQIGDRLRREVLGEKRAGYGEQIVSTLARQWRPSSGGASRRRVSGESCSSRRSSRTARLSYR